MLVRDEIEMGIEEFVTRRFVDVATLSDFTFMWILRVGTLALKYKNLDAAAIFCFLVDTRTGLIQQSHCRPAYSHSLFLSPPSHDQSKLPNGCDEICESQSACTTQVP